MGLPDAKSFETLPVGSYKLIFSGWEVKQYPDFDDKSKMVDRVMFKFEEPESGSWISTFTSTARSGRSKMRPILVALNGGRTPEDAILKEGTRLEAWLNEQVGMEVFGNVTVTADGKYNRLETVMAVPGGGIKHAVEAKVSSESTDTDSNGDVRFG